jgi:23S rRNA (guanosine2251-2'-O)-methyltransferase
MYEDRPQYPKRRSAPEGMIYGIHPVIEALKSGKIIEKAFVQGSLKGEQSDELFRLFKDHNIPYSKVPIEKLNQFTRANHQGIVAFTSPIEFNDIEDIIPKLYEEGKVPFILVLDRITDVRNFGAMARTAECCGIDAIVIPLKGGAPVSADAMKTSAGALNNIPVCRANNLFMVADYLKKSGLQIIACTEKTDTMLFNAKIEGPVAIIMGSEEDGISEQLLKIADHKVKIPMSGDIGSLNVSVAMGVVCYEVVRQRSI